MNQNFDNQLFLEKQNKAANSTINILWIIFFCIYAVGINTINFIPKLYFTFGMLLLTIFFVIVIFSMKISFRITLEKSLWGIYLLMLIFGSLVSIDTTLSIRYLLTFIPMYLILLLAENIDQKAMRTSLFLLSVFSGIHVMMNIIFWINPIPQISILTKLYSGADLSNALGLIRANFLVGITSDIGQNAFHISVFMMCMFSYILTSKNKIIPSILYILGIILLIGTTKRGLLIGNFLSIVGIVTIKYRKSLKKLFVYACIILIFIGLGWFFLNNLELTQVMLKKNEDYSGDVLNGRQYIYFSAIEAFKKQPLLGIGPNTTQIVTGGNDAHNIYLQVLTETGIFGFVIFILAVIVTIYNSIKTLSKVEKTDNEAVCILALTYQMFFLVYGMSGNPLYNNSLLGMWFLSMIIIACCNKKVR